VNERQTTIPVAPLNHLSIQVQRPASLELARELKLTPASCVNGPKSVPIRFALA
jgi:hypothetical protein